MHRDSRTVPAAVAIAWAFVSIVLTVAQACAATPVPVDIAAGPANNSITELGREADLQIFYDYDDVKSITTPAVSGNLKPKEALRKLLSGTGLTFKAVGRDSLLVYPVGKKEFKARSAGPAWSLGPGNGQQTNEQAVVIIESPAVRGQIPNLVGIDMLVVGREDIEKSGLTTTPQLVNTVPQNFGGGPNENTTRGGAAETNSGYGSGVNLRGLSDNGTIVLVNGRRLAPSGTAGAFTDISNLPLAAVDRMEVIPEGATALYGVEAIGGIVNFVTRQDTGFETQAEVGGLAAGAAYEEHFSQSYGNRWDSGNLFALLEYDERDALPADRRRLATSDLAPFGGQNFDTLYGNPGTIETYTPTGGNTPWGVYVPPGYTTWAIPRGQNGVDLNPAQLVANTQNLYNQYRGASLLPRQQLSSLVLSVRQEVSESTSLSLDVLLGHRLTEAQLQGEAVPVTVTNSSPYYVNPTGGTGPVTVFYGFGRDLGPLVTHSDLNTGQITAAVEHEGGIFDHLELYASYAYEREHQLQDGLVNQVALEYYVNGVPGPGVALTNAPFGAGTALNVFGDGSHTNPTTLAAIRAEASASVNSRLESGDLTAYRALFQVWGGNALLTLNEQYRRQSLESDIESPTPAPVAPSHLARTTLSTFAQLSVPIVSTRNSRYGIESLDLSSAVRYEHYTDVRSVTAPQVAVAWSPSKRVFLRGTYAQLSHAPDLPDLSEVNNVSTLYSLPAGKTTQTTALIVTGNNSQLRPETATSWTAGVSLVPFDAPTLSLGATYFHTYFTNRISDPKSLPANVLEDPSLSWLLRPVTPAEQASVCANSRFIGVAIYCPTTKVGAIVDLRLQNVASLETQGVDVAVQYELDHAQSIWKFGVNATRIFQYAEQQSPSIPRLDLLSTDHNPIDLRLRASFSWARHGLWARAFVNFQNCYEDVDSTPNRSISSWTTVDAVVGYDLRLGKAGSKELTQLSVSARNLFNHQPPFLNNQYGIGYDQENSSLLGRVVSFSIHQRW